MENSVILYVDGVPVRLKEPHDFSFLQKYGKVFCVFDANDSGNISFGVIDGHEKRFIKYAGACTINYDGSILYDFKTDRTTICDIDFYQKSPVTNTMGRMWGASRFMSLEEYALGAQIDELSNVFTLGALTFEHFGDSRNKSRDLWEGPAVLYEVVKKAISPERDDRYQSIAQFIRGLSAHGRAFYGTVHPVQYEHTF